jgi:aminoglycoside 6'-N-acetyltransferase I
MNDDINTEAIRITEFSTTMIDECTDLFLKVFAQEPWNDQWESPQDAKKYLESHYAFNSFLGYVAVYDNRIVGASFGFIKPWQRGLEYYINELFVDTAVQGKGVGTLLLEQIAADIKGKNMNAIVLTTQKAFPAYGFYVKNGFAEITGEVFLGKSV